MITKRQEIGVDEAENYSFQNPLREIPSIYNIFNNHMKNMLKKVILLTNFKVNIGIFTGRSHIQ